MVKFALRMEGISKSFGGVKALSNIDFKLLPGEIHGLLGENGAGKSTLIKVLGGILKPDSGEIFINDKRLEINNVQDARNNGIGIIHQEIVLVPELTVAENIFLGREPLKNGIFKDTIFIENKAREMLNKLGLKLDVNTKVSELTIAQQQLVEIAKAVSFDVNILVMDEPTSSLSGQDVENLFKIMTQLKKRGISIIYISHRFEELFEMTDRITVIRDGNYIDTVKTSESNSSSLVKLMVGRSIENLYMRTTPNIQSEIISVKNLTSEGYFEDVSFSAHKGEIVGFSGLVGAGRSELMLAIFGALKVDSGTIFVNGKKANIKNTSDAINYGIGMVPEDRKFQGLILDAEIKFNMILSNLNNLMSNAIFLSENKISESVNKYFNALNIKAPSSETAVRNLSGGNQQKVVLGKWLSTNPGLLILDEPTRGVDVGARSEIYSIINELSQQGIGIIMVSSDLPEILNMADRTYVMREGRLVKEIAKEDMTQETIMNYATGGDRVDFGHT